MGRGSNDYTFNLSSEEHGPFSKMNTKEELN
jgi:hypothetical protein